MQTVSLAKDKIKVLLLEGVHQSALDTFRDNGYHNIEYHKKALADSELKDLAAALKDGRLQKFAIANPEHAPYGARAREALQHAGLWSAIQPRLVLGENISQATQFATSGSTQGGIVAYSLALAPAVSALGSFALIPESWHQPLRQRMVLVRGADAASRAFYAHLQKPAAQAVLRRHGFTLPTAAKTP